VFAHLAAQLVYRYVTYTKETIFQINVTELKIPSDRRQTSWLFIKGDRWFDLGTTEKQIPQVAVNPEPPDCNTSALNHSATLPPNNAPSNCLTSFNHFHHWSIRTKQAIQLDYANRKIYSNIFLFDLKKRKEQNTFVKLNRIHRFINARVKHLSRTTSLRTYFFDDVWKDCFTVYNGVQVSNR